MLNRKDKTTDFKTWNEVIDESIKTLDNGESLDKQNYAIIREVIERQTGLSFDENDPEWNKFVIKYARISTVEISSYVRPLANAFTSIFMLYGILTFFLNFEAFVEHTIFATFFTKEAFFSVFHYFIFYIPLYMVTVTYVLPYLLTYYSLRKVINISRILRKNIKLKLNNWSNISVFILVILIIAFTLFVSTPQDFLQWIKQLWGM